MRGRNNNNNGGNRKGPNPLTRSYESNGPDVKIRGTAQHVGEKYLQLARDAQTSGDPVAAENYLQHAEHYFRIIAAAQQAQQQAQVGYVRQAGDIEPEDPDDDDLMMPDRFASPSERMPAPSAPPQQPYGERQPYAGDRQNAPEQRYDRSDNQGERPYRQGGERDGRQDRQERYSPDRPNQDRGTYDRGAAAEQPSTERAPYDQNRAPRPDRPDRPDRVMNNRGQQRFPRNGQDFAQNREGRGNREFRDQRDPQFRDQPRMPEPAAEQPQPEVDGGQDLPAFITAPVRSVPVAAPEPQPTPAPVEAVVPATIVASEPEAAPPEAGEPAPEAFAVRPRRRRRTRAAIGAEAEGTPETGSEPPTD